VKHRHVGLNNVKVINSDGHVIGIDLGATAVRAAILAPGTVEGRPSVTVHGLGQVALRPGAMAGGAVADPAAITTALKQLWAENKFECRNVILGVSGQQVSVRKHEMPNVNAEQRAKALPYQAREVIALPLDQAILDFVPLGTPAPGSETISGLMIAAPREPIANAVAAVERAGLRVGRVDLSSFALLRSIAEEQLSVEAVVDLGAHLTTIVVHAHGVPAVVRTIARGMDELTEKFAAHSGIDVIEAEAAKREIDLRTVPGPAPPADRRVACLGQPVQFHEPGHPARTHRPHRRRRGDARCRQGPC
jgi:type IV pilus assembly protein PilM